MWAVFRENGLPGRSISRYISTGVDIDRFLSKEVVEVQSLWPNIPGDKWNEMFSNTFLTICIFLFYAEQTLFLCPIFLFWNICLSAFFLPKILETCFFQQVFTFTGWNQDRTENLKYLLLWPTLMVLRVAHACSVPEFLWASVKHQAKETFWELSKEGDGYPHIQAILTSCYLICLILLWFQQNFLQ